MASLNPEQQEAVEHKNGPLLVIAGAGSGKTRIVTHRIANLLKSGIPASAILGLTFTNKAAEEMQNRVRSICQQHVWISTFHSLGAQILRESIEHLGFSPDFTIYDEEDVQKVFKSCLKDLAIKDEKSVCKQCRFLISEAKNTLRSPLDLDTSTLPPTLEKHFPNIYRLYREKMLSYNALDFDDLLFLTVQLFSNHPQVLEMYQKQWQYLLIDEYQDTNHAQYVLVQLLAKRHHNLCVVGDPDQSIYSWRGADISNILNFSKDYPSANVVHLEQNYRSCSNILKAANALIQENSNRYEKELWSDLGEGDKVRIYVGEDEHDEVNFAAKTILNGHKKGIPYKEMVIFYRTNFQSRIFEDRLLSLNIPYQIIGGISFYQRREIKDILAFLKVVLSTSDFVSIARTINLPKRGIGEKTLDSLRLGAAQYNVPLLEYIEKAIEGQGEVRLTARQKKGLQEYIEIIQALRRTLHNHDVATLTSDAISLTGYLSYLKEDKETFEDRKSNLQELANKAQEWQETATEPTLVKFLEELSLKTSQSNDDGSDDKVNLMTLHNGKGLEFDITLLTGMEEDLFPHINSRNTLEQIEEERRLCYVGMTRAKKHLFLTAAESRFLWGTTRYMRLSRFLKEVPSEYTEKIKTPSFFSERDSQESSEEVFEAGDVVFHNTFGTGVIGKINGSGTEMTYEILFSNDSEPKTLVARLAKLKKLALC